MMTGDNRVALITPSYRADFQRCRLLCDSVDKFVRDGAEHFILVDNDDYRQFLTLAGPHRHIINELDILPDWLHSMRQGLTKSARKIWFSSKTWPMRGWHVQQLRRIAIAHHLTQEALLYCDSDMLFVRPFDPSLLWQGEGLRLYRKPDGINDALPDGGKLHKNWVLSAARLNGLPVPGFPAHDYINNLVSWRRTHVTGMCSHIENVTGKSWVAALGGNRSFSECQIYGAYADGVLQGAGHWHAADGLCQTYWSGEALTQDAVSSFVKTMSDRQVAIGVQSFTGTDPDVLRHLLTA